MPHGPRPGAHRGFAARALATVYRWSRILLPAWVGGGPPYRNLVPLWFAELHSGLLRRTEGTPVQYTTFGRRTGLRVSEYALGTATFGTSPSAGTGREDAKVIFDAFAEAGGTFIDSADHYQGGLSETMLGEL